MRTDFQQIIDSPVSAYQEGLRFFMGEGILNETLRRVVKDLESRGIDYSVIGAVALNNYGYRRFTENFRMNWSVPAIVRRLMARRKNFARPKKT
jgi:hypothetical protein